MAANTGINVLTVTESTRFNPGWQAVRLTVVTYMVGNDGPFILEVGPEQDLVKYVAEQTAKKAADLAAVRNMTA